jgi:hypothetical protein
MTIQQQICDIDSTSNHDATASLDAEASCLLSEKEEKGKIIIKVPTLYVMVPAFSSTVH